MNEELFRYLSDEFTECEKTEEDLRKKKSELEEEKQKYEKNLSFHFEDEKKRRMFSPLLLHDGGFEKKLSYEDFELSESGKELQICENDLKIIVQKKEKLKGFLDSMDEKIEQMQEPEEKEESIPFFPVFNDVVMITKRLLPEIEMDYDKEEGLEQAQMTFAFLLKWKQLFEYFSNQMSLSYLLIQATKKETAVIIDIESISQTPLQEKEKREFEECFSSYADVLSWNDNSFEIKIIVK